VRTPPARDHSGVSVALDNLIPLRDKPGRFNAYLLNVDFEAPGGERWSAVGGGESVTEAIAAARDALPAEPAWSLSAWNHLYGD
jgi:hypothetical protein